MAGVATALLSFFKAILRSTHQGKQSVTADLEPLPQQTQRWKVFERSEGAQGDACVIKSCVGRPKIPFISLACKRAEKVAHNPEWGVVVVEERSKRDGNQNRNPCKHKREINTVDRHHPFFFLVFLQGAESVFMTCLSGEDCTAA